MQGRKHSAVFFKENYMEDSRGFKEQKIQVEVDCLQKVILSHTTKKIVVGLVSGKASIITLSDVTRSWVSISFTIFLL